MSERRKIRWLYEQLPALVARGVLTEKSAAALRAHYGEVEPAAKRNPLVFVGVFGSIFVGVGIILLVAHNWQTLGRTSRALLAFTPLLLAVTVSARVGWVRAGAAAREATAIFQSLAVAACLALISQTYHVWAGLDRFLIDWLLLSAPLVYLFRSSLVALVFVVGVAVWSGQVRDGGFYWFWALTALMVPFQIEQERMRGAGRGWLATAIALAVLWHLLFQERAGGSFPWPLRMVAVGGAATAFYLAGTRWLGERHPLRWIGALGIAVVAVSASFRGLWERGDFSAGLPELAVAWILAGTALFLLISAVRSGSDCNVWGGLLPVVGIVAVVLPGTAAPVVLFNAYALTLGVATLVRGVRTDRTLTLNAGLALISALTLARFFDSEVSFVLRGIVFILIGAAFLAVNAMSSRRRKTEDA